MNREKLKKNGLRGAAVVSIGAAAFGLTGCNNESTSNRAEPSAVSTSVESTPTATSETYTTIEALAGDSEDLKSRMEIPAGLSDEEFAKHWVDSNNVFLLLGHEDDFDDFKLGAAAMHFTGEITYDDFCDKYINNLKSIYKESVYADDLSNNAATSIDGFSRLATATCTFGLRTDPHDGYQTADVATYRTYMTYDSVVSSKKIDGSGRIITIRWHSRDNVEENAVNNPNSNIYFTNSDGSPKDDKDGDSLHEITMTTEIDAHNKEKIVDVSSDVVLSNN